MIYSAKTDLGKVRQTNQDYFLATSSKVGIFNNLFIVADGVGSNPKSGYASKHTTEFIVEQLKYSKNPFNTIEEMSKAIRLANTDLYYRIVANKEFSGMGTTLVMVTVENDRLIVANVGDSRCYYIRNDIFQITNDHSMAEELVRENEIERYSKKYLEYKNQLTRAVGAAKNIHPDFFEIELFNDDYILLCTDGLTNMLPNNEIFDIVKDENLSLDEKTDKLISAANENGGKDNIAIVLIKVENLNKELSIFEKEKLENQSFNNNLLNNNQTIEEESQKTITETVDTESEHDEKLEKIDMTNLKVDPNDIINKEDIQIYERKIGRSRKKRDDENIDNFKGKEE